MAPNKEQKATTSKGMVFDYWMRATTRSKINAMPENRPAMPSRSSLRSSRANNADSGKLVDPSTLLVTDKGNACSKISSAATTNCAIQQHDYALGADEVPFEKTPHVNNIPSAEKQQALLDVWKCMPEFLTLQFSMWHSTKPVNLFLNILPASNCLKALQWLSARSPSPLHTLTVSVDCRLIISNLHALDTVIFSFRNAADYWTEQVTPITAIESDSSSNSGDDMRGLFDVQYRSVRLATMAIREVLETIGAINNDNNSDAALFRVNVIFTYFEALDRVHNLSPSFIHWLFSLHSSTIRDDSSCIINTVFLSTRLFCMLRCLPYNCTSSGSNVTPLQLHWRRFSQAECTRVLLADAQLRSPSLTQQALANAISLIVDMFFHVISSFDALFDVCSFAISRTFKNNSGFAEQSSSEIRKLLIKHASEYAALVTSGARVLHAPSSLAANDALLKATKPPAELKIQLYRSLAADMPLLMRWTAIAAFLAANNPERADQILCAKTHGRIGRRERLMRDRAKLDTNKQDHAWAGDVGKPARISAVRIVKIINYLLVKDDVRSLPEEKLCHCAITTLVEDGLLRVTHADDQQVALGVAKYYCMISAALVIELGKSINFNVADHLYDASVLRS